MPKKAHVIEDVSGNTAVDLKVRSHHAGVLQIRGDQGAGRPRTENLRRFRQATLFRANEDRKYQSQQGLNAERRTREAIVPLSPSLCPSLQFPSFSGSPPPPRLPAVVGILFL
jgi:hypothetical protein